MSEFKTLRVSLLSAFFFAFMLVPLYGEYPIQPLDYSYFEMWTLPGGYLTTTFFENIVSDATMTVEESNGFAMLDHPRVYHDGNSFIHFQWHYDGYPISSQLSPGAPAFHIPFSSVQQFQLRSESPLYVKPGLNIMPKQAQKDRAAVHVSEVYPHLGSFSRLAMYLNPDHPSGRGERLYAERRQILSNYSSDVAVDKRFSRSSLMLSFNHFAMNRQFNDFNTRDATFDEEGRMSTFLSRYRMDFNPGSLEFTFIYHNKTRDRLFAELGRLPQETYEAENNNWFAGVSFVRPSMNVRFSALGERAEILPRVSNFSKELVENDGEGLYPFENWGGFSSLTFRLEANKRMNSRILNRDVSHHFYGAQSSILLSGDEGSFDHNAITYDAVPYRVILWEAGEKYENQNHFFNAGVINYTDLRDDISLYAKFQVSYQSLRFAASENDAQFFSPSYDIGLHLLKGRNPEILISWGQFPYRLRSNVNAFLETQRPWGHVHGWQDDNADGVFQSGEEGDLVGYTGGRYHFLDEDLKLPMKDRIFIALSTKLSERWRFNTKLIWKRIRNNLWVRFRDAYGFYETVDGQALYFFDRPYEDYVLTNTHFERNPFYGQCVLEFRGQRENHWYFMFSFLAHASMGYTPFGNGPSANDVGLLDESQANPNSWINGIAKNEGDRGYVSKCYFGFFLLKGLFLSAYVKYRDGTPFAFFDSEYRHDQWVVTYWTTRAEDRMFSTGPGPREDFIAEVSAKLSYFFQIGKLEACASISYFNLFDVGNELSENISPYGVKWDVRDAAELQIPKSIRFGLQLTL